jgi:AraC-like DNA-binding protein
MNIASVPVFCPDSPPPRGKPAPVAPVPRPFDFGFTASCPLVPLPAVMLFLNKKQRAIVALIEAGHLRWAFDIRSASAATREIRVLRDSLFEYTRLRPREHYHESDRHEFAEIIRAILPERKEKPPRRTTASAKTQEPVVSGIEVAQRLSCSPGHVRKLLRDNLLRAPGRHEPGDAVFVLRASVIEFLWKRRMT